MVAVLEPRNEEPDPCVTVVKKSGGSIAKWPKIVEIEIEREPVLFFCVCLCTSIYGRVLQVLGAF